MIAATGIVRTLREAGYSAYLVGGCVRDLLLHREPKDYDIATSARPELVLALFPEARYVGAKFGVVIVPRGDELVEVATYRSEHSYRDGRRPEEIRFETSPEADVQRRDFTINGLLMDPDTREVLDLVGGQRDLAAGVIRAIGDARVRFAEDHLRLLRAVRFAARLGFAIERETWAALRDAAPMITKIAAERNREELNRILIEGHARRGVEMLRDAGLLHELLVEVEAMQGVPQPPEYHPEGDVWTHVMLMLELFDALPDEARTVTLAWGVLLHDIAKPVTMTVSDRIRFNGHAEVGATMARGMLSRLRFPLDEMERIEALVADHMKFKDVRQMRESTLKRFLREAHSGELLELHRIDCTSSHGLLDNWEFVREKLALLGEQALRPERLLTGRDLMTMGVEAGPRLGELLRRLEDEQLEGRVNTRDEAMAWVKAQA